jgi:hypothetical protein
MFQSLSASPPVGSVNFGKFFELTAYISVVRFEYKSVTKTEMKKHIALCLMGIILGAVSFSPSVSATVAQPHNDSPHYVQYDKDLGVDTVLKSHIGIDTGKIASYAYEDGTSFFVTTAHNLTSGQTYICLLNYDPRNPIIDSSNDVVTDFSFYDHYVEEIDLQRTREAIRTYSQANDYKADSYGAITEKFRQGNMDITADVIGVLYKAEAV